MQLERVPTPCTWNVSRNGYHGGRLEGHYSLHHHRTDQKHPHIHQELPLATHRCLCNGSPPLSCDSVLCTTLTGNISSASCSYMSANGNYIYGQSGSTLRHRRTVSLTCIHCHAHGSTSKCSYCGAKLARGSRRVADVRAARELGASVRDYLWARHFPSVARSTTRVRERFFDWVEVRICPCLSNYTAGTHGA